MYGRYFKLGNDVNYMVPCKRSEVSNRNSLPLFYRIINEEKMLTSFPN